MNGHQITKTVKISLAALALALTTSACSNNYYDRGPKESVGTLGGAVLGGYLGSRIGDGSGQLIATGVGTLLGAALGNSIGRQLDEADKLYASQAHQQAAAAPIGRTVSWSNPDSGNYGTVTPVREGTSNHGEYCREFQTTIYVGGEPQSGYGTACRQPDGSWEILS